MSIRNHQPRLCPTSGILRLLIVAASLAGTACAADAATLNVPGTYFTIQAAVNAAHNGDTVLVAPGTYSAGADFDGKDITVMSSGGAGVTAIAAIGSTSPVFSFHSGESSSAVLEGFEIEDSAAMLIRDSGPTIKQCIFYDNTESSSVAGGAVYIEQDSANCNPTIEQCSFIGNSAPETGSGNGYGGAIGCLNFGFGEQNVDVINCVFYDNTADDDGAAIDVSSRSGSTPVFNIVNCTFNDNLVNNPTTGSQNSGVIDNAEGVVNITNSIMWDDNTPSEYSTVYCPSQYGGALTIKNSDIGGGFAGTGATDAGGNINLDPLFVSTDGGLDGNLRLYYNSPAINTGTTGGLVPFVDIEGNLRDANPDMGAYEYVIMVTNTNFNPSPNVQFTGPMATFVDGTDLTTAPSNFQAFIIAGDGTPLSNEAAVSQPGGAGTPYVVTAGHTWVSSGPYTLTVGVIANTNAPSVNESGMSSITVGGQTLTSIAVTPGPTLALTTQATQQFTATAYDQFDNPLLQQPAISWSLVPGGVGSLSGAGLYRSGTVPGTATVQAKRGAVSSTVAVTVKLPAPPAPTLTATSGASQVTLNWTASAGAQVYRVYRSTASGVETNPALAGGLTATSYTDSAVTAGATYYYVVTAVNTGGASPPSTEAHASMAPAAPLALTATSEPSQVTLNWTTSAGAVVYRVYRSTTSGGEANPALAGGLTGTSYADTKAVPGVTYYYDVTAVNTGGASPFSNEAHAIPAPAPPTLTATGGASRITLNWTAGAGAIVYRVYRSTMSGGEANPALVGGLMSTSYTDNAVTGGLTYYYEVTAVDAGGASPFSNEAPAASAPLAPNALTATAGTGQVTLNWQASVGATVYRVYRGTSTGGEANPALAGGLTSTSYTDTAAVGGTTYYYKVTAVNTGGASPFSNEAPATSAPTMSGQSGRIPSDAELVGQRVNRRAPAFGNDYALTIIVAS